MLPSNGSGNPTDGQAFSWAKTYGGFSLDIFYSVQQTSDGGFIAAGESGSFGGGDTWVVRMDSLGNVIWQNVYGGGPCEGASSVHQASDGGFLVVSPVGSCVLKLDSSGSVMWQIAYMVPGIRLYPLSSETTSDGGLTIVGLTTYPGDRPMDSFVLRLGPTGDVMWQKVYGADGTDQLTSIRKTRDGGFIASGQTDSGGARAFDAWAVRLDESGNVIWQKTFGGTGNDGLTDIVEAGDGSFVAVGGAASFGNGPFDIRTWALALDKMGNVLWQRAYGPGALTSVLQTTDGNFLTGGIIGNDAGFLKLDKAGRILWQRSYGGPRDDDVFSVQQISAGGFVAAGHTKSFGVPGEEGSGDAWILRLDSQGNIRGHCHQRGHPKEVGTDTLGLATTATMRIDDVVTIPATVNATITGTSAAVGVQCALAVMP